MLSRKPTRIELKREDLEEYEKAKKLWEKDIKKSVNDEAKGTPPSQVLDTPERLARIHERIGYNPQTVPSEGNISLS